MYTHIYIILYFRDVYLASQSHRAI